MLGSFASALIAIGALAAVPQSNEVKSQWETDYGRALAATRQTHRPLLIVLDVPGNAQHRIEPIRLVKEQSVNRDARLLESYELCHVDVSTAYGKQVAQAFKANTFPYTAIIDKSGRKIIFRQAGHVTDAEWQIALTTHQEGKVVKAAPASYSSFGQQQGFYGPSNCPSCQRGW